MRVSESADGLPTEQTLRVFKELDRQLTTQLTELDRVTGNDVPRFNRLLRQRGLPPVSCQA